MGWLTAALAFATTMLFYAVVVSTLVEMIHRFFKLRERGLQLMLESLYERVVKPQLQAAKVESNLSREDFAKILMANRGISTTEGWETLSAAVEQAQAKLDSAVVAALKLAPAPAPGVAPAAPQAPEIDAARVALEKAKTVLADAQHASESKPDRLSRIFRWTLSPTQMKSIPVEMFTQKLADSRIVGVADKALDEVIQDISQKYVAFGAEATDYFQRRARLLSVIVAFPVAFLFYVNPYDLAQTFIRNPDLAGKVAAYQVAFTPEHAAREDAPNGQGAGPTTAAPAPGEDEKDKLVKDLQAQLADLKQTIKQWDDLDIPVGWPDTSLLPDCGGWGNWFLSGGCKEPMMVFGTVAKPTIVQIFWLLIGSLLVGLGAPFWAQAVGALTVSRAATQKISSIVGGDDGYVQSAKAGLAIRAPQTSGEPTAVKTFRVSREASTKLPT